jgi:hypothetical protein
MPYATVREPEFGPAAFHRGDSAAAQAQAAQLLVIGAALDDAPTQPSRAVAAEATAPQSGALARLLDALHRRRGRPALRRRSRIDFLALRAGRRRGRRVLREGGPGAVSAELGTLADQLYARPSPEATAELLTACMLDHPDELVRVAAASSSFELIMSPRLPLDILVRGTYSPEPLVRAVAATALARVSPDHPRLRQLLEAGPPQGGLEPSHTSLIVHGTFARNNAWWQPGGDFHTYLLGQVRPDLYSAADRFDWSGGYSDAARLLGASDLRDWIAARNLDGLDLFTHSHGGSIAMLASQMGVAIGTLVLLSCPVHPQKYWPNFTAIQKIISIRVRLDLVLLADRSAQSFDDPAINEHILPIWFNHFATHDPPIWTSHTIPSWL